MQHNRIEPEKTNLKHKEWSEDEDVTAATICNDQRRKNQQKDILL